MRHKGRSQARPRRGEGGGRRHHGRPQLLRRPLRRVQAVLREAGVPVSHLQRGESMLQHQEDTRPPHHDQQRPGHHVPEYAGELQEHPQQIHRSHQGPGERGDPAGEGLQQVRLDLLQSRGEEAEARDRVPQGTREGLRRRQVSARPIRKGNPCIPCRGLRRTPGWPSPPHT